MSSHRPTPAFARNITAPAPYSGRTVTMFSVTYILGDSLYEGVLFTVGRNECVMQLMTQMGVGDDDWYAEPVN